MNFYDFMTVYLQSTAIIPLSVFSVWGMNCNRILNSYPDC